MTLESGPLDYLIKAKETDLREMLTTHNRRTHSNSDILLGLGHLALLLSLLTRDLLLRLTSGLNGALWLLLLLLGLLNQVGILGLTHHSLTNHRV